MFLHRGGMECEVNGYQIYEVTTRDENGVVRMVGYSVVTKRGVDVLISSYEAAVCYAQTARDHDDDDHIDSYEKITAHIVDGVLFFVRTIFSILDGESYEPKVITAIILSSDLVPLYCAGSEKEAMGMLEQSARNYLASKSKLKNKF
ncbi:hypothetical protein [Chromobacterium vaccinii]|uniref:hypothetical protein n=1 Tax=Chromobacterium vaccinii TaxID=1108595 RepID=UPI00118644FF|nr:hypothetical protein [Chromobacterium vaccinii]